jgi:tripartite-type tricarboxylate transporter receptor subunit TctC
MHRMMNLTRRALLAAPALVVATPALAFPDRTLRIISGFPPGGTNDIVARALAAPLATVLGQPVVVENRPGAGGGVGAAAVARATPDGHTLYLGIVDTQSINPLTYRRLAYDPERDFAPISLVTNVPFAMIAGPGRPQITDMKSLIAAAKAAPGQLTYASWGVGSTPHLAFLRLAQREGIDMLHVPFGGPPAAVLSMMAGQVDVMMLGAGNAESFARDARIRVIATVSPERLELLPQVPTLKEQGFDMPMGLWQALYAPARTPDPVVARLVAATHEAMRAPGFIEVMRTQGAKPAPTSPAELLALQREEREAYAAVVRSLNLVLD